MYRHANQFPLVRRSPGLVSLSSFNSFPSLSLSLFISFFLFPSSLSRFPAELLLSISSLISAKGMGRWSEKDDDRRCTYNTYGGVSRLGHGSFFLSLSLVLSISLSLCLCFSLSMSASDSAFRVSPRVPGKRRTCDPSAETGRRRRSNTVSPLVLPLPPFTLHPSPDANSHASFFVSPRLFLPYHPPQPPSALCWY